MQIIPAIDIRDGKCMYQGISPDPITAAKYLELKGFHYLHLVDIDAVENKGENIDLIKKILSLSDIEIEVNAGNYFPFLQETQPWQVITTYQLVGKAIELFGKDSCTVSLPFEENSQSIATVLLQAKDLQEKGIRRFVFRNKDKDGTLQGISKESIHQLKTLTSAEIIISGGVSSIDDIMALEKEGIDGVIIGKAFHSQEIDIDEVLKRVG